MKLTTIDIENILFVIAISVVIIMGIGLIVTEEVPEHTPSICKRNHSICFLLEDGSKECYAISNPCTREKELIE